MLCYILLAYWLAKLCPPPLIMSPTSGVGDIFFYYYYFFFAWIPLASAFGVLSDTFLFAQYLVKQIIIFRDQPRMDVFLSSEKYEIATVIYQSY